MVIMHHIIPLMHQILQNMFLSVVLVLAFTSVVIPRPTPAQLCASDPNQILALRQSKRLQAVQRKPSHTIIRLRFDLIGAQVSISKAAQILQIKPGTRAEILFQQLINLSQDARHIYDPYLEKEFIVFLDKHRDYVAVYTVIPLCYDPDLGYTVIRNAEFFKAHALDHLLVHAYRRLVAARRIKRSGPFRNWLERPRTQDGQLGIEARLTWKAIQNLNMKFAVGSSEVSAFSNSLVSS